ncbi:hypothetical protein PSU4_05490 [Pseudonocardia sulfidoxydans NBRC 16205]|uniref:Uncharacterized protein n=1 Tax=Pseudonocardia sulfidoxydans NBRC 16205 TaxID=1223511 RepID=A0A511D9V0_9PSEU|nr:hypothetical protein PSU4_05490 [Pseudonocardia sulfidoxydans NBRC 16205]
MGAAPSDEDDVRSGAGQMGGVGGAHPARSQYPDTSRHRDSLRSAAASRPVAALIGFRDPARRKP